MIRRPSAADLQMCFSSPLLQALSPYSNLWIVRNRRATTSPLSLRIMGYPSIPPLRCCLSRWLMWMMKHHGLNAVNSKPKSERTRQQEQAYWVSQPQTGIMVRNSWLIPAIIHVLNMPLLLKRITHISGYSNLSDVHDLCVKTSPSG